MNSKIKVGITGQSGFLGYNLYNELILNNQIFSLITFSKSCYEDRPSLLEFVSTCDVIVHFAAVCRCKNPEEVYSVNMKLVESLISALVETNSIPYLVFSSSIQENDNSWYGKSKRDGSELFHLWATTYGASFSCLILPNIFGPFCKPNYSSFIATFAYKLTHGEEPIVITNNRVKLLYVRSLCKYLISKIISVINGNEQIVEKDIIEQEVEYQVTDILDKFLYYKISYLQNGIFPILKDINETNLFYTFISFIDLRTFFPVLLNNHVEDRGTFVETVRSEIGGQVSFSLTKPGITRGNHYHTRKIERFIVLKGNALIQIRKKSSKQIFEFILDGDSPSYVDIPIWCVHNIKNIGTVELVTIFWTNEFYNSGDPDTYSENVQL